MHRAIAAYAKTGNNVIVDYINYDSTWIPDLKKSLIGVKTFFVRVTASLETIEAREKSRGTSPQGHARSHYDTVHKGLKYDLKLNTDDMKPKQAAQKIVDNITPSSLHF